MRPLALPLLSLAAIVLLLGIFGGSDRQEKSLLREGVTLEENRSWMGRGETLWKTPLTPAWTELLLRARKNGWQGKTNGTLSGLRTGKGQKRLWKCFRAGRCPPAFHPQGPSRHIVRNVRRWGQWSQAVDVSRPGQLVSVARELGVPLRQPYLDEPWHVEALAVWTLPDIEKTTTVSQSGFHWTFALSATLLALAAVFLWFGHGGGKVGRGNSGRDPAEL